MRHAPHVQRFLEPVLLSPARVLLRQGTVGDSCFVIDTGTVRVESMREDGAAHAVTTLIGPGSLCGELSFIDGTTRTANAVGHTEVRARRLTRAAYELLRSQEPLAAVAVMEAVAASASQRARVLAQRLHVSAPASGPDPTVEAIVTRATDAQRAIADLRAWPEQRVDDLLEAIGKAICDHADELARAAVAETGIGNAADKAVKNRFAAADVAVPNGVS